MDQQFIATDEQTRVLDLLQAGKNVLLVGEAGTGKTATVKYVFTELCNQGIAVDCTAPTGLAAQNFEGGQTLARFIGLGRAMDATKRNDLFKRAADRLTARKYNAQQSAYQVFKDKLIRTQIIIIDEVSMTTDFDFEMLEFILRRARGNREPFGGAAILAVGDFRQIPPVNVNGTVSFLDGQFISRFEKVCLTRVFRQTDAPFLSLLNRVAKGEVSDEDEMWFAERTRLEPPEGAVALFATNATCDAYNERRKAQLVGEDDVFVAHCSAASMSDINAGPGKSKKAPHFVPFTNDGMETLTESARRAVEDGFGRLEKKGDAAWMARANNDKRPCSAVLRFRAGAPVMIRANVDIGANGTLATYLGKTEHGARIALKDGKEVTLQNNVWEMEVNGLTAYYKQIPLALAYGLSIHKSQGQGFPKLWVDFADMQRWPDLSKLKGMAYVALSRAIDPNEFYQKGFDRRFLVADKKAVEFYENIV